MVTFFCSMLCAFKSPDIRGFGWRHLRGGLGIFLGLMIFWGHPSIATAQRSFVDRIGSATVKVYEDNLDAAKSRALRLAREVAVERYLSDLVPQEWLSLYQGEIRRNILLKPNRYISSYRVQSLDPSIARTKYSATLSVTINREALTGDLRRLSLPIIGDPTISVVGLYPSDDPALRNSDLRAEVQKALQERLVLMNMKFTSLQPVAKERFEEYNNPQSDPAGLGTLIRQNLAGAGLLIRFNILPPESGQIVGQPSIEARFARGITGAAMGSFSMRSKKPYAEFRPGRRGFMNLVGEELVTPLVRQFQPASIRLAESMGDTETELKLQVYGFQNMGDEENFERAFFKRDSAFGKMALSNIRADSVIYEGAYAGDRRRLESSLLDKTFGDFRIQGVSWFNEVLEVQVKRITQETQSEMRLFPVELRPPQVTQNLADMRVEFKDIALGDPEFTEAEDNGWLGRSNRVPLEAVLYGFLDSREDTDFYVVEELEAGEKLRIGWYRMGRSNLKTLVRIFDQEGNPVRELFPRNFVETEYELPKGHHLFYIQVRDRYGAVGLGTGGYQFLHYLLQVSRGLPQ